MHERLVNYLRDNRDQILESWLTEADLPLPPNAIPFDGMQGTVPLAFLEDVFERLLKRISGEPCNCHGHKGADGCNGHKALHLDDFLNITCACSLRRMGGRVCIELHQSGRQAFHSIFENGWDAGEEFNEDERKHCLERIDNALASTFGEEVGGCRHSLERPDCPFRLHLHLKPE